MLIDIKTFLTYSKRVPCPPSTHEQDFGESLQGRAIAQRGNCYLDHQTKPLYRNVKKQFKFYMKMTNGLKSPNGTYPDYEIQYPIINHYKIGKQSPQIHIVVCASPFLDYFLFLLLKLLHVLFIVVITLVIVFLDY